MRVLAASLMLLGLSLIVVNGPQAGEKKDKEVTLKGTICCAKCELNKSATCATVIVVTEKDKKVIYYFDAKSDKEHHESICTEAKKGEITAVVSGDAKKKVVSVKKLKFE